MTEGDTDPASVFGEFGPFLVAVVEAKAALIESGAFAGMRDCSCGGKGTLGVSVAPSNHHVMASCSACGKRVRE